MKQKTATADSVRWNQIRAAVFDVDGTLYDQPRVRKSMAKKLLAFYLLHLGRIRELLGIFYFRKIREESAWQAAGMEEQAGEASRRAGLKDPPRLLAAIRKWMFDEPLPLIAAYRNEAVLSLLHRMQAAGQKVIIYSDYAPEEKLSALGVSPDAVFYPGSGISEELKPSETNMRQILKAVSLPADQIVFLGDRDEKDGASARLVGMPFVLVTPGTRFP